MPRNARIDIPGLLQHVIARGIERRPVFLDDQDKRAFLSRLFKLLQETETTCLAWALLENHFHLLLRPKRVKLAEVMRRLLTGYAVEFNLRHQRAGHLFQNRYKSIVCDEDPYLLELVRYIHLNPLRAGVIPSLAELEGFAWCGHAEILGKAANPLISVDEVLALFSRRRQTAKEKYRTFIADGLAASSLVKLSSGGKRSSLAINPILSEDDVFDERVLGGGGFVENLLLATSPGERPGPMDFSDLAQRVTDYFKVDSQMLAVRTKERNIAAAKAVVCHVALRQLGMPGTEVARMTSLSPSGVTRAARRGGELLRDDRKLRECLFDV